MADGWPARATVVDTSPAGLDLTEPVALVLEECAVGYGRDLLAYLLGAGAETPLADWRLDEDALAGSWDRLRAAYHVLQAVKEPRRARAWMRRSSPLLGGRTFAWAVRTGDPDLLALVEREAGNDG
jgi:hypothetical protein